MNSGDLFKQHDTPEGSLAPRLDVAREFLQRIPKADIHVHFEGLLGPALFSKLATEHSLPDASNLVSQIYRKNYRDLDDFIVAIRESNRVIVDEEGCYLVVYAFLKECRQMNVVHVELSFEPEFHIQRGLSYKELARGITRALDAGRADFGITSRLILSLVRDLSEKVAFENFRCMQRHPYPVQAVGLASRELDHPIGNFKRIFDLARNEGYWIVAHAGEEGPPTYVSDALIEVGVDRINHGTRAVYDPAVMRLLSALRTPVAACPISNLKTKCVSDLAEHPIIRMLRAGIVVSINSDDPGVQQSTLIDDYMAIFQYQKLKLFDLAQLATNSFVSSFLDTREKAARVLEIEGILGGYLAKYPSH